MMHDRSFWSRHVRAWRASGLTQREYGRRHRISKGSLGYWASTLNRQKTTATDLVQVGKAEVGEPRLSRPIELVVEGRYLLRLWPGVDRDHMKDVLAVLEGRS